MDPGWHSWEFPPSSCHGHVSGLSGSKHHQTGCGGVAERQGPSNVRRQRPRPALTQQPRAADTPPLPSSKTRPWGLVSLTVEVRSLKGLISSKEPSQMSPGVTDPLSPCSSVRLFVSIRVLVTAYTCCTKTERSWEVRTGSGSPCSQKELTRSVNHSNLITFM